MSGTPRPLLLFSLLLLGSGRAAAGDDEPHRPEGRLDSWLLEARATRVERCSRSPQQDRSPCLYVGLQLFVAAGPPDRARLENASRQLQRLQQLRQRQSCSSTEQLLSLLGGDADGAGGETRRPRSDDRRGLSLLLRVDQQMPPRGRRSFGDRLDLVVAAVLSRLERFSEAEAEDASARRAAAVLVEQLAGAPHYQVWPGVVIPWRVELKLAELARAYYRRRGRRLVVTSGTRSATSQAEAMYTKLAVGGRTRGLYRKWRSARAVERVYRRGRARRWPRPRIIEAMTREIKWQIDQGVYLSPHLRAGAVDLRSRGLRRNDRRQLLRLARSYGWLCQIKLERRPPHFHLRFATADDSCERGEDLSADLDRLRARSRARKRRRPAP